MMVVSYTSKSVTVIIIKHSLQKVVKKKKNFKPGSVPAPGTLGLTPDS